jgi:hypothetical protein
VSGWPDYVGIVNAFSYGVGGVVIGELVECIPTVFQWEWPPDIKSSIRLDTNPTGSLTNSDLEMAGVLLLWLVMEKVCHPRQEKRVALFSDNSPMVSWVTRLASQRSLVAEHLVQALALRLKSSRTCPLTALHSRSFGSNPAWHCKADSDFFTLFNSFFPLPLQNSWTASA